MLGRATSCAKIYVLRITGPTSMTAHEPHGSRGSDLKVKESLRAQKVLTVSQSSVGLGAQQRLEGCGLTGLDLKEPTFPVGVTVEVFW